MDRQQCCHRGFLQGAGVLHSSWHHDSCSCDGRGWVRCHQGCSYWRSSGWKSSADHQAKGGCMTWTPHNAKSDESSKIRWELVPYMLGDALDIGPARCASEDDDDDPRIA